MSSPLTLHVQRSERGCEILWQLCFQQEEECAGAGDPPGLHVLWNSEIRGEQHNCSACRTHTRSTHRYAHINSDPVASSIGLHQWNWLGFFKETEAWIRPRYQVLCVRLQGPIKVTVQELDGSFNHTLQIEENSLKHDIPCHSKSRRWATLKCTNQIYKNQNQNYKMTKLNQNYENKFA